MARLKELFDSKIKQEIEKELGLSNPMKVPRLEKIVINMSDKDCVSDSKVLKNLQDELALISGQKPIVTKAKKSIAAFKLREGMPIGCKVTLRRDKMYEFLDRLTYIVLPRVRDFNGLSKKSFDGKGNYNFGFKEQTVFPEISYDKIMRTNGMNITIVTTTDSNDSCLELLKKFNLPFRN
ncbi:MAG: 50S ribosomal protein L5 [Rickettsiales bacterium]|nr:50S ribosomal protein L5 [Rickettsiales bacterium]